MADQRKRDKDGACTSTHFQDIRDINLEPCIKDTGGACTECDRTVPNIKKAYRSEKHVLLMHVQYWVLGQSRKKGDPNTVKKVRSFTDEFFKKVCSLRNSRGGVLAIHVQGMEDDIGPSLDHFDEKVSKDLSNMIEDDSPYAFNYQRQWFQPTLESVSQSEARYIVVIVKGSSAVSTKNFNTLVPFDGSKERPRAREVAKYLSDEIMYGESDVGGFDKKLREGERVNFIESRSVQFKSLSLRDLDCDAVEHSELKSMPLHERLVYRIVEKLDMLQYITAFTKLKKGGSFYLGIEEDKKQAIAIPKSSRIQKPKPKSSSCRKLQLTSDERVDDGSRVRMSTRQQVQTERSKSRCSTRVQTKRSRPKSRSPGQSERSRSRSRRRPQTERSNSRSRRRGQSELSRSRSRSPGHSEPLKSRSRRRGQREHSRSRSRSPVHSEPLKSRSRRCGQREHSRSRSRRRGKSERSRSRSRRRSQFERSRSRSSCKQSEDRSHVSMSRGKLRRLNIERRVTEIPKPPTSQSPATTSPMTGRANTYMSHSKSPGSPGFKETKTGHNIVRGFALSKTEKENVESLLRTRITENMMWLQCNGDCLEKGDIFEIVDLIFHKCTSEITEERKYVLEVCVKRVFRGLVFFTKDGPEAYRLMDAEDVPKAIPVYEWMKLLKRASVCASCVNNPDDSPQVI